MRSDVQEAERGPDQLQCEWFGEQLRPPGNPSNIYQCSGIVISIIIIYRKNFITITIILIVIVVGNRITVYYSEGIKIQKKSELPID